MRDLLLGHQPKDFDVATDATPEEVRAIFRRSRIIGRRFRLVHVMCGAETVEVSTFRGAAGSTRRRRRPSTDEHGRILRDNVFGTQGRTRGGATSPSTRCSTTGDARRSSTIHGGVADIKASVLRMIGDPAQRYREDPVRMLRAVRLRREAAASRSSRARARRSASSRALLQQRAAQRALFDEMLKLLLSGHARECVRRLRKEGLHHGLLPLLDVILEQPLGERFVMLALENTDERINDGKPVSPGFLFASLLWHEVLAAWKAAEARGMHYDARRCTTRWTRCCRCRPRSSRSRAATAPT